MRKFTNKQLLTGGGVVLILVMLFMWFRKVKEDQKKKQNRTDNAQDAATLQQSNPSLSQGSAVQRVLELKAMAEQISKAFWSFQTFAWGTVVTWRVTEDEEAAIQAINQAAGGVEAAMLSDYYAQYNDQYPTATIFTGKKGLSLLADCKKFLNNSEFNRIRSEIRNSLK